MTGKGGSVSYDNRTTCIAYTCVAGVRVRVYMRERVRVRVGIFKDVKHSQIYNNICNAVAISTENNVGSDAAGSAGHGKVHSKAQ